MASGTEELGKAIDLVEETYEYMLAYAAQGLADDAGTQSGSQIREFLRRAGDALRDAVEKHAHRPSPVRPASSRMI